MCFFGLAPSSDFLTLSSLFLVPQVCLEVLRKIFLYILLNDSEERFVRICHELTQAQLQVSGEPYEAFSRVISRINKAGRKGRPRFTTAAASRLHSGPGERTPWPSVNISTQSVLRGIRICFFFFLLVHSETSMKKSPFFPPYCHELFSDVENFHHDIFTAINKGIQQPKVSSRTLTKEAWK